MMPRKPSETPLLGSFQQVEAHEKIPQPERQCVSATHIEFAFPQLPLCPLQAQPLLQLYSLPGLPTLANLSA